MNQLVDSELKDAEDGSHGRFSIIYESNQHSKFNEKQWEWTFLRKKCRNLELEQFYQSYMKRLRVSYLSLFIAIQGLVVVIHSILLLSTVSELEKVYPDVLIYILSTFLVWSVLAINYRQKLVKRHTWIMFASSWVAITIMLLADISVPVMHSLYFQEVLRPAYANFVLFAIYIFMPLPSNIHVVALGLASTACYILCFTFITYRRSDLCECVYLKYMILVEVFFLLCLNALGLYFRMMKEVTVRTTFLDRRQCVEENLLLRYARDQEKKLLLSILPARIANKIEEDVKIRIEQLKVQKHKGNRNRFETRRLFIEPHDDVTILYADVVNYTFLTTTLDVKTLVETIHDLFVRFDQAAMEHNVLRIKFLGDCYYCVSGVPVPDEYHAKNCVNVGLAMIRIIHDVRAKRKLDIDMRIGVHSGNIFSGVIGASKWQFDIWSKDVDIANRLEQTGQAGRVHVSNETLKLLDGEYMYEEGTLMARTDEVLKKYSIRTFLIKTPRVPNATSTTSNGATHKSIDSRHTNAGSGNFMENTIVQYNHVRTQAKLEMSRELDKMPIGRIQVRNIFFGRSKRLTQDEMEGQSFRSNITSLFLFFKDWRWEWKYMQERDVMLKYSIFFSVLTFITIISIQAVDESNFFGWYWYLVIGEAVLCAFFLVITWYHKIWVRFNASTETAQPSHKLSKILFNISSNVEKNVIARISMYLLMVTIHALCTLLRLVDCSPIEIENSVVDMQLFEKNDGIKMCFNPWGFTDCIVLTICMNFLFTRIPFAVRLCVGALIAVVYIVIIFFEFDFMYERSMTTNELFLPEYAHLVVVLTALCIFHFIDRQTEFISKVDFNWKRQLQKKHDDAKFTNETIKILINNILPSHVADIYMTKMMTNELYYEEYDNVAVMFASIKNYDTEHVGLHVLNEIICDFDNVLNSFQGPLKVEKIKVAGWTYMAACGLDLARSEHVNTQSNYRNSSLLPNGRRSHYVNPQQNSDTLHEEDDAPTSSTARNNEIERSQSQYTGHTNENARNRKISSPQQSNVVLVMTQFALELMRTLQAFNVENLQSADDKDRGMLRIGISNGEIMAGVVGSYKPHYDIWGNPVNMASRMDSTGITGKIQVTEETAKILESFNIKCIHRGLTTVKGRGNIETYFVEITDDLEFVPKDPRIGIGLSKSDQEPTK